MRWTTTVAMLVLVGGMGLYAWKSQEPPQTEQPPLFAFDVTKVTKVEIRRGEGEPLVLERQGETAWRITAPIPFDADREAVDQMLQRLTTERPIHVVDDLAPADAGLAPPRATITVHAPGGTHTLEVGNAAPLGTQQYARRAGGAEVLVVAEEVAQDALRPEHEYRDRTVLDIDKTTVERVEIAQPSGTVQVGTENGRLWVLRPARLLANRDKLNRFLDDLSGVRAKKFVSDAPTPEQLSGWGFDEPALTVTLDRSGGADPLVIDFGRKAERGEIEGWSRFEQNFFRVRGAPFVYLGDVARPEALRPAATSLREDHFFPFAPTDLSAFEIRRRGDATPLRWTREGEAWTLATDGFPERRTDAEAVRNYLQAIGNAAIDEVDPDPRAPRRHGLDDPAATVRLEIPDRPAVEISFAGPDGETCHARVTCGEAIEEAALASAAPLLDAVLGGGYERFRHRGLFEAWDDGGTEIVVTRAGDTVRFVKKEMPDGSRRWTIPDSGEPDAYRPVGISLERALAHLSAVEFVRYSMEPMRARDLREYGLQRPLALVRATFRRGAESGEADQQIAVEIGSARADGTHFARLADDPSHIFAIPQGLARDVLGNLAATIEERSAEGTTVPPAPPGTTGQ